MFPYNFYSGDLQNLQTSRKWERKSGEVFERKRGNMCELKKENVKNKERTGEREKR